MIEKNKPAHGGNRERATERTACGVSIPCNQCTTISGRTQGKIEKLLPRGESSAIPTQTLVELTGLRSARALQAEIERERLNGALILSRSGSGGGYFLPDTGPDGQREIAAFVRTLHARAVNTLRTLRTAQRALNAAEGQRELKGWNDG